MFGVSWNDTVKIVNRVFNKEKDVRKITISTTDVNKHIKTTRIPYTDLQDMVRKLKFLINHATLNSEARHIHIEAPGVSMTISPKEVVE